MCQTVVELQEQSSSSELHEEQPEEREMKTQQSGLHRVLSPSRGDKEKYLRALNEAIAMGRRSCFQTEEESCASDRRCVKVMLVKQLKSDQKEERPVMCRQQHDDDEEVSVQEQSVSSEDHQDEPSVMSPQEVEEVKQEVHRSRVSRVCVCVCVPSACGSACFCKSSPSSLRSVCLYLHLTYTCMNTHLNTPTAGLSFMK